MNWWKNPSNGSLKDFGYKGLVIITLCNQTNNDKNKTFNASYFLVLKVFSLFFFPERLI
jgi:hypothetical protein